MTRDRAVAEDIVQDTLVRALERAHDLDDPARLRPWVFRIAHNLVVDRYRRTHEEPSPSVVEEIERRWRADDYTVDAEVIAERAEVVDQVRDALAHLPVGYRSVLLLHDGYGWTSAEVATTLGIGLPAAKQRLRRGRMMLVSALGEGSERRRTLSGVPLHCWDARRHVSAFLDDELDVGIRTAVIAHLERCPTCPPLYASLVSTRQALAGFDIPQDPDSVVPGAVAVRIRELRRS